jgi:hypothetical protein
MNLSVSLSTMFICVAIGACEGKAAAVFAQWMMSAMRVYVIQVLI